jgi:hypothetical protein
MHAHSAKEFYNYQELVPTAFPKGGAMLLKKEKEGKKKNHSSTPD